jgi:hypothetical protein
MGRTFNAEYYRDNILTALTQLQPETTGENSLFMLIMQGLTLLKNVELLQRKWTAAGSHPP